MAAMTLASVTAERLAEWTETLLAFGWDPDLRFADRGGGQIRIRALRPGREDPAVTLDVREHWAVGPDPDGLGLEAHGCHLLAAAWHAQLEGAPPAVHAHRLDVARGKARPLMIHLHPHGSPNDVRVTRARLGSPGQWIVELEGLVHDLRGYWT
jgi:hypothetical protein